MIDSYSDSSDVADQVADLPPKSGDFRFLLIDSYAESWDLAQQVADLSLQNGDFRFLLIDSYSESSDLAYQVADLPPKWQFEIPTDTCILWELRCGRPGGRSSPPEMAILYSCSYVPTLTAQMWQTRWQIYLPEVVNFRFLLIESYSESTAVVDLAPFQW